MNKKCSLNCELAFAVALYKATADTLPSTSNLIICPYSVESVLACFLPGTEGEIHANLLRLLCPNGRSVKKLCETLLSKKANGFAQANAVFYDQNAALTEAYRDALKSCQDIHFVSVAFATGPQQAIDAVNSFLHRHSPWTVHDVLPHLHSDEVQESALIVLSTINFSGAWDLPFQPLSTFNRVFHCADGTELFIPFLNSEELDEFRSYNVDAEKNELSPHDPKVLILDIRGKKYSVMFLLPEDTPGSLGQLERRLAATASVLVEWRKRSLISEIKVALPKFRISTNTDLIPCTKALGLTEMYQPSSSMSKMFGNRARTKVADFAQNTMLDVDEHGITASTVTMMRPMYTSNFSPEFEANRPFMLIIWDNNADFPLFIARITNPSPTVSND
ncbi:serine protease inhibitor 2.1-like [Paramacrobiotus metropolitanus]|uniref:serine protease inhibitor 2.1-like n=1 Tax=Paramacrobiotus metropolitanus TaxID=2943436 RepID=UPI002445F583|nr:serine protease inhibitor 2.1-like [Paramacrobiotus metropolitanus]